MKKLQQQKGFTLVELAIVLTIIGLLIGGILKGQQLMQNSRVTATVAQIKAIEASTTSFRDFYNALPGDLKSPNTKIPECCGSVNPTAYQQASGTADGTGDGFIGRRSWDMQAFQGGSITNGQFSPPSAAGDAGFETILFWYELEKAGLISAVSDAGITASGPAAFGKLLPSMKLGGGFWVGNSNDADATATSYRNAIPYTLLGAVITTVDVPDGGNANSLPASTGTGLFAMTPAVAGQIDRKVDDGVPGTGGIQAFGVPVSCYGDDVATLTAGTMSKSFYKEGVDTKDCGLHIRIQQ